MRFFLPLRSPKGLTLVETVVAIALASVVISAIVGMVVLGVATSTTAKARTTATRFAEEGMEAARAARDKTDWSNFWNTYVNSTVWHIDNTGNLTSGAGLAIAPYTREVHISNSSNPLGNNDKAQVDVKVTWVDKGKTEIVELVSFLTKWAK